MLKTIGTYFGHCIRIGDTGLSVFDKFNRHHAAKTADIADRRHFAQPRLATLTNLCSDVLRAREQITILELIHHFNGSCTRQRIPTIRATNTTEMHCIHDFGTPSHCRQWHPCRNRFSRHDDVGLYSHLLHGKQRSRTPKATLYLVSNKHNAVFVTNLPQSLHVTLWHRDEATLALYGLNNNGCHCACIYVRQQHLFELIGTRTTTSVLAQFTLILVGKRCAVDLRKERSQVFLECRF